MWRSPRSAFLITVKNTSHAWIILKCLTESVMYFHIVSTHAAFQNLFVLFIYVMLLRFVPTAPALRRKITFSIIGHSPLKLNKSIPFCQTPPLILSLSP